MWAIIFDILIGAVVLALVGLGGYYIFQNNVQSLMGLSVGQIVQVKFKGCPDVLIRAAYDSSGKPSDYDADLATHSVRYCEMPLVDKISRDSYTTWIIDAGWDYRS